MTHSRNLLAHEAYEAAAANAFLTEKPCPKQHAFYLSEREAQILKSAWLENNNAWRVGRTDAPELARHGLCEIKGPYLTAFGIAVRKEVMKDD